MARRSQPHFPVRRGFSVGIVLTTPPFPYTRKQVEEPVGLPVVLDRADLSDLHFGEVGLEEGQLVTSGLYGWTMVATGTGPDVETARRSAYELAGRVFVPGVRYRLDIGERLIASDYEIVAGLGLFSDGREPTSAADR